jgi:hypothetical protein
MTEPTDAELDAVLYKHWPAFSMRTVFVRMWLRDAMRAALAKWGTPQPVVREPLTDAQIAEMMRDTWGCASIAPRYALQFARDIERAHGITQKGGSNAE